MPCNVCTKIFPSKPCEHPTGILTESELLQSKFFSESISRQHLIPYIIEVYNDLHSSCPCIECLVKMICSPYNDKVTIRCRPYNELLDRSKPIFYRCQEDYNKWMFEIKHGKEIKSNIPWKT